MDQPWSNRGPAADAETRRASRAWWDGDAVTYLAEHGAFLGDDSPTSRFVWGPEGLTDDMAGLLGDVRGQRVLEVGTGGGHGARWLAARGARVVGLDLSAAMLAAAALSSGAPIALVQADATALPFADQVYDLACSAYGAVPFVADLGALFREVHRVLRPGGRWVFSTTHPIRWAFPDDPGPGGLTADRSYFDRTPYVERDDDGTLTYVEHHRTLGDVVGLLVAAGLVVDDLTEPEWQPDNAQVWGGWSPQRGALLPGTVVWSTHRPA